MSIARDRANRSGTDPLQIDNTKLITDSGDLKVQDTSGNEKKLIADEIHVGTGSDKVILKRDSSTGKVAIQTQASGEAAQGGVISSTTIYATTDLLPTNPSDGEQALVTANNFLYIAKSNGWYKIAEITNTTPSITSAGDATYQFLTDGTPVSIEITATDAEVGTALQYKYVVSSGSIGSTATVTSSATSGGTYSALAANTLTTNKFFKVTPSTNSAHAGTFSLTFSASDGVAVATSSASSFTLQFDVSGSYKFDGSGDYVTTTDNASYALGTGAFSVECFYNVDFDTSGSGTIFLYDFGSEDVRVTFKSGAIRAQLGSETQLSYSISGNTLDKNTFHHHALIRDGSGKVQLLHNGSEVGSYTGSTYNVASTTLRIGDKHSGSKEFTGYISNFRIVKGSTAYTATSPSNYYGSFTGGPVYKITNASITGTAAGTALSLGTGAWTVEAWIYTSSTSWSLIDFGLVNGTHDQFVTDSGNSYFGHNDGSAWNSLNWWSSSDNGKWNHIAYVSESSTVKKIYKNGVLRETFTSGASTHYGYDSADIVIGERSDGYYRDTGMKLSNLRIVKGTAVYTGAFTPPTSPLTAISGTSLLAFQQHTGSPADRSGNNVSLVADHAGTASTDSPFVPTFTVPDSDLTAITNTKLLAFTESTPENITTGSTLFDGTNDSLSIPNFAMGTSDYTIEMWFRPTSLGNYVHLYDGRGGSSGNAILIQLTNTGTVRFYSVSFRISGSDTVSANTWNHVALERVGNINTLYLNGVSQGTYDDGGTSFIGPANNVGRIGSDDSGSGSFFPGYISDFRIVIGSAVYNGAFTPPTSTLTAITNTQILTSRTSSGTITDASSNNHTITANNGAAASAFGVVKPPTDISTASNTLTAVGSAEFSYATPFEQGTGGSTLFYGTADSSNDYLTIASSSEFAFGTNDFTIEFFLRAGTNTSNYTIICSLSGSTGAKRFEVAFHNSTIQVYTDTGSWRDTGYTPTSGAWEHFAFQRDYSENTLKMFVDGKLKWSVSNNRDYDENQSIQIGSYASGSYGYLAGYLSNFRIVNGSTVYTPNTTAANASGLDFTNTGRTSLASHSGFDFGTNDFTVEFFYKWGSLGYNTLLDHKYTASDGFTLQSTHVARSWFIYGSVSTYPTYESSAASAGIWHHYAIVRNGNVVKMYRDGVETISKTHTGSIGSTSTTTFGNTATGNAYPDTGSVSNFRVVKGTALYTSAGFTPPSSPLTAVSGTALLLFQENSGSTLSDGSSNNVAVTKASQHTILTNDGPFYDSITVPTSKLTAVTNTKLLTCNDSNVINDASSSSHNITISGNPIATRFNPF